MLAGIDQGGMSAIVSWVSLESQGREELELHVGGIEGREHLIWVQRELRAGDVITIEVLGSGPTDPLLGSEDLPRPRRDRVFGRLECKAPGLWVGATAFPHPPGAETRCGIVLRDIRPKQAQLAFAALRDAYVGLWAEISGAVARTDPRVRAALDAGAPPLRITLDGEDPGAATLAYGFEALELEVWVVVRDGGLTECSILPR